MNISLHGYRVVFAGTPAFSIPSLNALIGMDLKPMAVITQPDRRSGRGKVLTKSPIKKFAENHAIPVWQPITMSDSGILEKIRSIEPDLLVVAAYGMLLPRVILDIPKYGCLNVHASLLPKWRGASPIQSAILYGDTYTGVSLMKMEEGLDSGPVFSQHQLKIKPCETADELDNRLAELGAYALNEDLLSILNGNLSLDDQDTKCISVAKKIKKSDARIDWKHSSDYIARHIRAYNSYPGAHFCLDDEFIKCWLAESLDHNSQVPGKVTNVTKSGIEVACGQGTLRIKIVQRPGKNKVSAIEFSRQVDIENLQFT